MRGANILRAAKPLGIAKGKTFSSDERQTKILKEGAALGELMARNLQTIGLPRIVCG
jgi:hypothetical protein